MISLSSNKSTVLENAIKCIKKEANFGISRVSYGIKEDPFAGVANNVWFIKNGKLFKNKEYKEK